jgi:SAM-dependent methyltransferase
VLEHLPDPRETLLEIQRVLEPGGRLVVAVPNFSSLQARWLGAGWFHLDLPRHLYHFPLAALRRLLEDTGFEVEGEHHFSLRQNPFGWIQSLLNLSRRLPRNGLYSLLHDRRSTQKAVFSPGLRALLYAVLVVTTPLAIALSIVAALLRQGATVHVVATRRDETIAR